MEWVQDIPTWAAVLMIAVIGGIGKLIWWSAKLDTRVDSLENRVGALEKRVGALEEMMKEVRNDIKIILNRLLTQSVTKTQSPIGLTEFGKEVAQKAEAETWAAEHTPTLAPKAQDKEEYEVFDLCVQHVEAQYQNTPEFKARVRSTAYQFGIEAAEVLKVHEVVLRDSVLKAGAPASE